MMSLRIVDASSIGLECLGPIDYLLLLRVTINTTSTACFVQEIIHCVQSIHLIPLLQTTLHDNTRL